MTFNKMFNIDDKPKQSNLYGLRDLNPIFKWTILIVRSFTGILLSLGILAASVALFIYGWPYFFDNFNRVFNLSS